MGKSVNKIMRLDPLRGGDVLLEKMGLPNMFGEKTGMAFEGMRAEQAAKDEAKQLAAQQARAEQAARDARVDLRNQDYVDIQEGAAGATAVAKAKAQRINSTNERMNIRRSLGL